MNASEATFLVAVEAAAMLVLFLQSLCVLDTHGWQVTLLLGLPHIVNDLTGDLGGTYMISPVG
jgi:hypothetical protein